MELNVFAARATPTRQRHVCVPTGRARRIRGECGLDCRSEKYFLIEDQCSECFLLWIGLDGEYYKRLSKVIVVVGEKRPLAGGKEERTK